MGFECFFWICHPPLALEVRVLFTAWMEPVFQALICEGGRRRLAVLHGRELAGVLVICVSDNEVRAWL